MSLFFSLIILKIIIIVTIFIVTLFLLLISSAIYWYGFYYFYQYFYHYFYQRILCALWIYINNFIPFPLFSVTSLFVAH